ncbi:MAG: hypothetical protein A3F83_09000 [Candidatus Glassbacteria bacterium RIFCSPLOWO2_12_FULL_58_11]|uniref:Uncharacterized protein n=1 Tax=Candidatus Glassbacteria bacterium RIFCSPLOWO2_12_FULL_58_11 TaxID=1817867 RepID=A0A1F5YTF4_9BACT|nr:MAG: hypothetical protein A3F83_09000 [Candidatus Glassbacteria bacterium RIFCSPLOWO2_12_FULL_58_11]
MFENAEETKKDAFQVKVAFICGVFQLRPAEAAASGLWTLRVLQWPRGDRGRRITLAQILFLRDL